MNDRISTTHPRAGFEGLSRRYAQVKLRQWIPGVGLVVAVLAGVVLRFLPGCGGAYGYDCDQSWMFTHTQAVRASGQIPTLGVSTSLGIPNFPLSVWVFDLPTILFGIDNPIGLARLVEVCSIAAILIFSWFSLKRVDAEEREPWLWAVALASVNPMVVFFQQKIWAQSMVPLPAVLMLICWWRRERFWAAFLWGFLGILTGQIHLSGFFLVAGFISWVLIFDRRHFSWTGWFLGCLIAAIPMIPWLRELLAGGWHFTRAPFKWWRIFELKYWIYWVTEPLGIGLHDDLRKQYVDFLGFPRVGNIRTWLGLGLHVIVSCIGVAILIRALTYLVQNRAACFVTWRGTQPMTLFTLRAAFWGTGLAFTISGILIARQYLYITFPLTLVWVSWLALLPPSRHTNRVLLLGLCAAQFLLSVLFFYYYH